MKNFFLENLKIFLPDIVITDKKTNLQKNLGYLKKPL